MSYRAPLSDILFTMVHAGGLDEGIASGLYPDLADGAAQALLDEAAKFAENRLAPINRDGDLHGAKLENGVVRTAPGWRDAYAQWIEGGWNAVIAPEEWGGMGLPLLLNAALTEMWNSANMAFALCPLLGFGAMDAVEAHASDELKVTYLPKMVSGVWTATMNLTEPGAGSDLNNMRTRAERAGDGSYRISGQKIYITYGEHDMTDNIVHLVLARLNDAPAGTRGISLFLVPKFLVNADGSLGPRNDVKCTGIEHKLGVHGSPTCTLVYGDNGGAIGYLIGEENKGLACMFTMMNSARLSVGLQGVAIGEGATQQAMAFARERKQGRASDGHSAVIAEHPDVKRMLMTMRVMTMAARAICYATAGALDQAHRDTDEDAAKLAAERAALLTPVAKGFSTDAGNEIASLGVQVHGGMGFVEDTGAAQYMRDVRIAAIYEGTNGIQAMDLVQRKLPLSGGSTVRREIAAMREELGMVEAAHIPGCEAMIPILSDAITALDAATVWMLAALGRNPEAALAGASPYLRLFGIVRGGISLATIARAAHEAQAAGDSDPAHPARIVAARFFAKNIATSAPGLLHVVTDGAASVNDADMLLAS